MTTTYQKLLINIIDQNDLPLLYKLRERYGYGIGIEQVPPESLPALPTEVVVTSLLFHKFTRLLWTNPDAQMSQKSTLTVDSGQIKKIVTWLESDYEPPVRVQVGDFTVVADEGKIRIRKEEITRNELQAVLDALSGIDLNPSVRAQQTQ